MNATSGDDTIATGAGDDQIFCGNGDDYVDASDGDDQIDLYGGGADTIIGGAGEDELIASPDLSDASITGVEILSTNGLAVAATPTQFASFTTIGYLRSLPENAIELRLASAGAIDFSSRVGSRWMTVVGSSGDDDIVTGSGNDHIYGRGGNDTLLGGIGDDHVHGEDGDDLVEGGAGDDFVAGDVGTDIVRGTTATTCSTWPAAASIRSTAETASTRYSPIGPSTTRLSSTSRSCRLGARKCSDARALCDLRHHRIRSR